MLLTIFHFAIFQSLVLLSLERLFWYFSVHTKAVSRGYDFGAPAVIIRPVFYVYM